MPTGETGLAGALEDRPVALFAEQFAGAAQQQHMGEILVARAAADFNARCLAIFIGDDD